MTIAFPGQHSSRIDLSVGEFIKASRRLKPLSVSVHRDRREMGEGWMGEVIWGTKLGTATLLIAWDWGEVCAGVVALADPSRICCNARLSHDAGGGLSADLRLLYLNTVVHSLRWQRRAASAIPAGGPLVGRWPTGEVRLAA